MIKETFTRTFRMHATLVLILLAAASSAAEVALPNLDLVNADVSATTNLWQGAKPLRFPSQIALDFSRQTNGVILGVICEYPKSESLFKSFRARLQRELKIEPILETEDVYVLWRDNKRRRTITLTLDGPKEKILVVAASLDKKVRGPSFFGE